MTRNEADRRQVLRGLEKPMFEDLSTLGEAHQEMFECSNDGKLMTAQKLLRHVL